MQNIFDELAPKFPGTKFLKSIATLCVPNFPGTFTANNIIVLIILILIYLNNILNRF